MTEAAVSIRTGRDDDAWDLIGMIAACWAEYPGCVLDVHREERWLLAPATYYKEAGGGLWVAENGCRVVASVALRPAASSGMWELKSLYVARSARRHGLGARLTALVEKEARRRHARALELWSDTRFLDAHRLYARLGYHRSPNTRDLHDLSNSTEFHFWRDL